MNLTELKAAAWDAMRQVEVWNAKAAELNKTITQAEQAQAEADNAKKVAAQADNVESTKKLIKKNEKVTDDNTAK